MQGPSAARFDREHMRRLAAKSAEVRASRVYLTRDEASALVECYALLRGIARRSKIRDLVPAEIPENDEAAPVDAAGRGV